MALLTPYWGLDGLLVFVSLLVAAYLFMTRKFKYWEKQGIVELKPTPFLGNFTDCFLRRKSPAEFVKDLYDQTKGLPYAGFYIFDKPIFLVRDPEIIKHVMIKDFNVFVDRYASVDPVDTIGHPNVFLMTGNTWKLLRSKLSPFFTSGKLKKMFSLMVEVADDLDRYLDNLDLGETGKEVEFKDLCANFTTDMIGSTAFGVKVNSIHDPDAEFRKQGRKLFNSNVFRAFELLSVFFIPDIVKYTHAKLFETEFCDFLRKIFWQMFDQRVQSGTKRFDLIDLLIELREKDKPQKNPNEFRFDGDNLVGQAAIFFSGGFETSSTTMSFTLYELALHQDIQKRLRKEILDAMEETGGKITYEMVMTLPYLHMVISETLRKYPPLAFLDRRAGEDYKVPGTNVVLKKGTPVYIPMLGLHMDPQYFPEPEKFDPERFNEENKARIPSCVYFPFGEGPRICLGLRLGLIQSKIGVMQVLKKYMVCPNERTTIPMSLDPKGLTTTALGGVYLNLRKITTDAA